MDEIAKRICREMTARKQRLALAESCTGGAISARIVSIPGASVFFLGSIVAYANGWKEQFLHVRRKTLSEKGAVSREAVIEMIEGLFVQTDADYAVAVSGSLGPFETAVAEKNGKVFIGVGKKGEQIDVGQVDVGLDRMIGIERAVEISLDALLRRVIHNALTFS